MAEGKFPLTHGLRGVKQRRMDILGFKVGEAPEDLVGCHPLRHHGDNGGNGNTKPTNARHAVHLLRVDRNSVHDGACFRDSDKKGSGTLILPWDFTSSAWAVPKHSPRRGVESGVGGEELLVAGVDGRERFHGRWPWEEAGRSA